MSKFIIANHRRSIASGIILLVTALAGVATWALATASPIPREYRSGLHYSLYYPEQLPASYTVDRASFRRKNNVLIFTLTSPQSRTIAVSEETLPSGLNLNQSSPSGISLPTQRSFTTSIGQASLNLWGNNTVVSIQAGSTWILLNVTGVNPQTAISVGSSFKPL